MRSGGGNLRSWVNRDGGLTSWSSGSSSSTGSIPSTLSLLEALPHPWHQAAHPHELGHELRERLGPVLIALGEVADHALLEVDLQLVAGLDGLGRLRRLEDRVAQVDRVAEEDAGERVRDDTRDAGAADGDRGDLAGRAAPEVGAADHDVAGRHLARPAALVTGHALHRVLAELLLVQGVDRVLGRDDLVGVDVVAERPGPASEHGCRRHTPRGSLATSLGWVISPVTALAAATAGLAR